jgi:Zn-dependent alcohol dehydrogenase
LNSIVNNGLEAFMRHIALLESAQHLPTSNACRLGCTILPTVGKYVNRIVVKAFATVLVQLVTNVTSKMLLIPRALYKMFNSTLQQFA